MPSFHRLLVLFALLIATPARADERLAIAGQGPPAARVTGVAVTDRPVVESEHGFSFESE